MKILGFEITRRNRLQDTVEKLQEMISERDNLSSVLSPNSWYSLFGPILEANSGDWQKNIVTPNTRTSLLMFSAVYCCVTGIATDISKLRIKLCQEQDEVWEEIEENSPWLPLLRKPNHYQTRLKFVEQWIISKLLAGNTYVAKERDQRGIVNRLYVLDPCRVKPMISDTGEVFYSLGADYLSGIEESMVVPASEIIHDMMPALYHPLCGTPPLYACAASAEMGNSIQTNSKSFFKNRSLPSGLLTAPGKISDATAKRLKDAFEKGYGGDNLGKTWVGGDGLKFEPIAMTAEQSLLVEQLKWSVGDVARAFHYPEFKLGGPLPPYSGNMQALTLSYYTDCLQSLIESMEAALDDGLELPLGQGTELDIDNLLRMDTASLFESNNKAVGGGWMAPDEARQRANYPPVEGGDTPYLQQQNYALSALAKRDAGPDPFASKTPPAPAQPAQPTATPPATAAQREDIPIGELSLVLREGTMAIQHD